MQMQPHGTSNKNLKPQLTAQSQLQIANCNHNHAAAAAVRAQRVRDNPQARMKHETQAYGCICAGVHTHIRNRKKAQQKPHLQDVVLK